MLSHCYHSSTSLTDHTSSSFIVNHLSSLLVSIFLSSSTGIPKTSSFAYDVQFSSPLNGSVNALNSVIPKEGPSSLVQNISFPVFYFGNRRLQDRLNKKVSPLQMYLPSDDHSALV